MDNRKSVFLKPWGNSQGIMVSKDILKQMDITDFKNQELTIEVQDEKLIIEKNKRTSRLMSQFHDLLDNRPNAKNLEYSWGQPRGKELF